MKQQFEIELTKEQEEMFNKLSKEQKEMFYKLVLIKTFYNVMDKLVWGKNENKM